MNRYGVSGPTAATAATVDNAIAQLWNPSTARSIFVKEIHLFKTTAGAADIPRIRHSSARGTASTSFTPGIEHDFEQAVAAVSGAILDLAFSVQPTFTGTASRGMVGAVTPGAIGAGIMWVFERPIAVKQSNGLAVVTGSGLAYPVSEVAFVWDE